VENPAQEEADFKSFINPDSLEVLENVQFERSLLDAEPGRSYQFLRKGYFCLDQDSSKEHLIFNRTVTLKDTWAREKNSNG
jgi:glutaminyl-tRNA synthetase